MVAPAQKAAEILGATVVNMRFVKPLDETLILELAGKHELLVTVEENVVSGGAGSAINECLIAHDITIPMINLGLPDKFIEQGTHGELLSLCGLDAEGIQNSIEAYFANKSGGTVSSGEAPKADKTSANSAAPIQLASSAKIP
jgi:1-deoxy-D-xylulose-5-phosphate synthase